MKQKNKGADFSVLLGTLGASLLWNLITVKGIVKADEGMIRTIHGF